MELNEFVIKGFLNLLDEWEGETVFLGSFASEFVQGISDYELELDEALDIIEKHYREIVELREELPKANIDCSDALWAPDDFVIAIMTYIIQRELDKHFDIEEEVLLTEELISEIKEKLG